MTVIELFSVSPTDNMISCLTVNPDKVLFVGDGRKMRNRVKSYAAIAKRMGLKTVFEYKSVTQSNLNKICDVLIEIVEAEDECCFDLTGGSELALVAIGMVYQKYVGKRNLQMQRYNVSTGKIIDCDGDGNVVLASPLITLTCKEVIALHGGRVADSVTYSVASDILFVNSLWEICRKRPAFWNASISAFNELFASAGYTADMHTVFNKSRITTQGLQKKLESVCDFLNKLAEKGMVANISSTITELSFDYTNATVKKCLSKEGNVLEAKAFLLARIAKECDGTFLCNDCLGGVAIDWDGENKTTTNSNPIVNEVDLIVMRGYVPIFVSCKNGSVDNDELYKLSSVAEIFGGKYAKKVLLITKLNKDLKAMYLLQRAEDMGIRVVANAGDMTDDELAASIIKV